MARAKEWHKHLLQIGTTHIYYFMEVNSRCNGCIVTIYATNSRGGQYFVTAFPTGIHGIHLGMGMSEWGNDTRRAIGVIIYIRKIIIARPNQTVVLSLMDFLSGAGNETER
jgi:hypothetical protein